MTTWQEQMEDEKKEVCLVGGIYDVVYASLVRASYGRVIRLRMSGDTVLLSFEEIAALIRFAERKGFNLERVEQRSRDSISQSHYRELE